MEEVQQFVKEHYDVKWESLGSVQFLRDIVKYLDWRPEYWNEDKTVQELLEDYIECHKRSLQKIVTV